MAMPFILFLITNWIINIIYVHQDYCKPIQERSMTLDIYLMGALVQKCSIALN